MSYLTYGFDRIPPSSTPISLIPAITVKSDQLIPFEVEGLEEGDLFRAFSDANCADPLTEKIVAIASIPTKEGSIPPQSNDFTLYGQFYDVTGNPSSCERLQEVSVINQRTASVFGVSDQPTFVGSRIAGGHTHTCVVKNNQEIDCWGNNEDAKLGDDTTTNRGYPSHVIATDGDPASRFGDAIQVVAGRYHSCALKENGTVYCWGEQKYLGIDSAASGSKDHPVPVTVSATENLSNITQIDIFDDHTCAVNSSGNVYCWGEGNSGKLGNGINGDDTLRATLVVDGNNSTTALTGISKVSTGGKFTCALKTDGGVLCWGSNEFGQLGNGNAGTIHDTNYPVAVIDSTDTAISGISAIALGSSHACALTNAGKVLCWGSGSGGSLGNDGAINKDHPVYVVDGDSSSTHLTGIMQISAGVNFSCALNERSNVYCWGLGLSGRLGNDDSTSKDHPVHVVETENYPASMLSDVAQIRCGQGHACALKSTGEILCWGKGQYGILGDNNITNHTKDHPVSVVTSSSDTSTYDLGDNITCKTDENGIETCNPTPSLPTFISGQLEESADDSISIDLEDTEIIVDISFYSDQYCTQSLTHTNNANPAIISNLPWDETIHIYFKRGARSLCYDPELSYRRIPQFSAVRQKITAGNAHTCALADTGGVLCWGKGSNGQLGDNTTTYHRDHPVAVKSVDGASNLDDIVEVGAGGHSVCALNSSGKVLCWGNGNIGQLGNDKSDQNNALPTYVVDGDGSSNHLENIVQITTGANNSCALKADGGVLCWGDNVYGQLGNNASGNGNNKDHPVAVKSVDGASDLSGINYIAAGSQYTCALSYTQKVYCWGRDDNGQLGNSAGATASSLPVLLVDGNASTNGLSDITQIATGDNHGCALKNGNTYCWGFGVDGQLGNGESSTTDYPVLVIDAQNSTTALANIDQLSAGNGFSCAVTESGGLLCWGTQLFGRLGNNETSGFKNYPVNVKDSSGASASDISSISQIALGNEHGCALKNNGEILCWGTGYNGQLGNDALLDVAHAITVVDGDGSSTALDLGTPTFSRYVCNTNDSGTSCETATD